MIYNVHRDAEKDPSGLEWRDFYPEWKKLSAVEEQSEDEMFSTMLLLAKSTEGLSH